MIHISRIRSHIVRFSNEECKYYEPVVGQHRGTVHNTGPVLAVVELDLEFDLA